jgi:hypothetical protein
MSAPSVLRACEVRTIEEQGSDGVVCGDPGQWWEAPSGKAYVICDYHREAFMATAAVVSP